MAEEKKQARDKTLKQAIGIAVDQELKEAAGGLDSDDLSVDVARIQSVAQSLGVRTGLWNLECCFLLAQELASRGLYPLHRTITPQMTTVTLLRETGKKVL